MFVQKKENEKKRKGFAVPSRLSFKFESCVFCTIKTRFTVSSTCDAGKISPKWLIAISPLSRAEVLGRTAASA